MEFGTSWCCPMRAVSVVVLFLVTEPLMLTAFTSPPTTTRRLTTIPTTISTGHVHGCMHEGRFYPNGADINRDENNCFGLVCEYGHPMAWDDKCFLVPPTCPGSSERVPGQCCPLCHTTRTTIPTTTPSVPENGCLVNGIIYQNYDRFNISTDRCTGYECHYGTTRTWKELCPSVENCSGTVLPRGNGCCKQVCVPFGGGCEIRGKIYKTGEITNDSPCNVCECGTSGQEKCNSYSCENCSNSPNAKCCQQTCGASSKMIGLIWYGLIILGFKSWW